MKYVYLALFSLMLIGCGSKDKQPATGTPDVSDTKTVQAFSPKTDQQLRKVAKAVIAPQLDGLANDPAWENASWYPIDQNWLGKPYEANDFQGRYKLAWTPEALYILAQITDDVLYDQYEDPLTLWWDDDCLEIFVDADNSGGPHQFTHNAFAYHVALDGNVVDIAPGEVPTLYNSHVRSKRQTTGNITIWECAVTLYNDNYTDGGVNDQMILAVGQKVGFALAYCDNDDSVERENFIGSIAVAGEDKNRGWIDASIFGTLLLEE